MNVSHVTGDRLVPKQVYFIVMHADEKLTVPVVQTLIYIGTQHRSDGGVEYRFQEIKTDDEPSLFVVQEEHVDQLVVDRDGLIDCLSGCEKREGR